MPQLKDELAQLVAIQCVPAPGFPEDTRPALVGVRYDKWIRFMLPLMALLAVACFVMLGIAALLE